MKNLFEGIYNNRKILITGNTGFKGSWLALWLQQLGANVLGFSLEPTTNPNHFELLNLNYKTIFHDINDCEKINEVIHSFQPDVIFHLAAQPIVKISYAETINTIKTNVLGTANVLESCKKISKNVSVICITSDKCYKNKEWPWGYREIDELGGYDPYSASKACAELIISSYRDSFFNLKHFTIQHNVLIASVRAGNVIGGGDWSPYRLVPDIMEKTSNGEKVKIRNALATRPWQHVLEPLSGYLWLGVKLISRKSEFAKSWNFGPEDINNLTVKEVVDILQRHWEKISYYDEMDNEYESKMLKLDCSQTNLKLSWHSVWNNETAIKKTVDWYKNYYDSKKLPALEYSKNDIESYVLEAKRKEIIWS